MMRINEIVDHYELWGAKPFVDAEHKMIGRIGIGYDEK